MFEFWLESRRAELNANFCIWGGPGGWQDSRFFAGLWHGRDRPWKAASGDLFEPCWERTTLVVGRCSS